MKHNFTYNKLRILLTNRYAICTDGDKLVILQL